MRRPKVATGVLLDRDGEAVAAVVLPSTEQPNMIALGVTDEVYRPDDLGALHEHGEGREHSPGRRPQPAGTRNKKFRRAGRLPGLIPVVYVEFDPDDPDVPL